MNLSHGLSVAFHFFVWEPAIVFTILLTPHQATRESHGFTSILILPPADPWQHQDQTI